MATASGSRGARTMIRLPSLPPGSLPVFYSPSLDFTRTAWVVFDGQLLVSKRAARALRRRLARQDGRPGVRVPSLWRRP